MPERQAVSFKSHTPMKSTSVLILALGLFAGGAFFSGCASDQGSSSATPDQTRSPEAGMTKDQVVAMYGKTDDIITTGAGETWTYNLSLSQPANPLGPSGYVYRPRSRIVNFDTSGHVTSWSYKQ
jgi:hypothetical protein